VEYDLFETTTITIHLYFSTNELNESKRDNVGYETKENGTLTDNHENILLHSTSIPKSELIYNKTNGLHLANCINSSYIDELAIVQQQSS
jgi:hypothetical protein